MKRAYVVTMRVARHVLRRAGVLAVLDRAAGRSRNAHWVRSWFAIHDMEDMMLLGVPWWTYEAIDLVEEHLRQRPRAQVFEWGAGASTLWLARRAATVSSVEHDPAWAAAVAAQLPPNARVRVVPATVRPDPVTPSSKRGFGGLDFTEYVAAIEERETLFDLVVVDGRAREACLTRAFDALRPDGVVLFDNVDRRRYRAAISGLGTRVEVMWTRGRTPSLPYPTRTALLRRVGSS